jgi:hypothetical protein
MKMATVSSLIALIASGDLVIDMCHLERSIVNIEAKIPDTGSETIFISGTLEQVPVICKLSFPKFRIQGDGTRVLIADGLTAEREIYDRVIPAISLHTVNVVRPILIGKCDNFRNEIMTLEDSKFKMNMMDLLEDISYTDEERDVNGIVYFTILERSKDEKLDSFLDYLLLADNVDEFWIPVLMQIAYVLAVFEEFGLMHNDLHPGNVLIDSHKEKVQVELGPSKTISTKYVVRVFDFDHSSKQPGVASALQIDNHALTEFFCPAYGECNTFVPKFDWFLLLRSLYGATHWKFHSALRELISKLLSHETMQIPSRAKSANFNMTDVFAHNRPCLCRTRKCRTCELDTAALERVTPMLEFLGVDNTGVIPAAPVRSGTKRKDR